MKRVLKEVKITRIAAVDYPCQEGALAAILKGDNFGGMIVEMEKHIKSEDGKFVLYSQDETKVLGKFDSKDAALKREAQIKYFEAQKRETHEPNVTRKLAIERRIAKLRLHLQLSSLQDQVDAFLIGKYDENEARDENGKWTSGGGGGGDKDTKNTYGVRFNVNPKTGTTASQRAEAGRAMGKTPGMQRHHYEVVANALAEHGNGDTIKHFASAMRGTNQHFQPDKFAAWATVNKSGRASRADSKIKSPMTRQHFNFIADTIRSSGDPNSAKLASVFASHLGGTNKGFKADRFIARASGDAKARKRAMMLDLKDLEKSALALAA